MRLFDCLGKGSADGRSIGGIASTGVRDCFDGAGAGQT